MTPDTDLTSTPRQRSLVAVLAVAAALPLAAENPEIPVSQTLTTVDTVSPEAPRRDYSVAGLRELVARGQLQEVASAPVVVYGEHTGDQGVWEFRGVRVLDLVRLAAGYREGMDNPFCRKHKSLYLAACATDAYGAVLSWSELLFSPTGALALVAYGWKLVKAPPTPARAPRSPARWRSWSPPTASPARGRSRRSARSRSAPSASRRSSELYCSHTTSPLRSRP